MVRAMANPCPVPRPTFLVVKKGSNTLSRMASGMPVPVSSTSISTAVAVAAGADGDRSPSACPAARPRLDGVRGVDDQVQEDLVQVARPAGYRGQIVGQIGNGFGNVFPFVSGNRQGVFDGPLDVDALLLVAVRMGEFLHGSHDLGDPLDAFQRLVDGGGNLRQEKLQVRLLHAGQDRLPVSPSLARRRRRRNSRQRANKRPEFGKGVAEKAGIVADILGRGVDLVRDSGGQLPDGFQLLGLRQLGLQHPPLGDIRERDHGAAADPAPGDIAIFSDAGCPSESGAHMYWTGKLVPARRQNKSASLCRTRPSSMVFPIGLSSAGKGVPSRCVW